MQQEQVASLDLHVSKLRYRIVAPDSVSSWLRPIFARHEAPASDPTVVIAVSEEEGVWRVTLGPPMGKTVDVAIANPFGFAEAVVQAMSLQIAAETGAVAHSASAVCREGRAVLIVGPGAEAFLLIAHLTARGWSIVSNGTSFVASSGAVSGLQRLFCADATMLPRIPAVYRAALERSPWCVDAQSLWFYAVDPTVALGRAVWSASGHFHGIVRLTHRSLPFGERSAADGSVELTIGDPLETADLFERWCEGV